MIPQSAIKANFNIGSWTQQQPNSARKKQKQRPNSKPRKLALAHASQTGLLLSAPSQLVQTPQIAPPQQARLVSPSPATSQPGENAKLRRKLKQPAALLHQQQRLPRTSLQRKPHYLRKQAMCHQRVAGTPSHHEGGQTMQPSPPLAMIAPRNRQRNGAPVLLETVSAGTTRLLIVQLRDPLMDCVLGPGARVQPMS